MGWFNHQAACFFSIWKSIPWGEKAIIQGLNFPPFRSGPVHLLTTFTVVCLPLNMISGIWSFLQYQDICSTSGPTSSGCSLLNYPPVLERFHRTPVTQFEWKPTLREAPDMFAKGNSTRDMKSFQQTQTSSRLFGYDIQYNTTEPWHEKNGRFWVLWLFNLGPGWCCFHIIYYSDFIDIVQEYDIICKWNISNFGMWNVRYISFIYIHYYCVSWHTGHTLQHYVSAKLVVQAVHQSHRERGLRDTKTGQPFFGQNHQKSGKLRSKTCCNEWRICILTTGEGVCP